MPDPRESRNICNMLGTHQTAHFSYTQKEHGKKNNNTILKSSGLLEESIHVHHVLYYNLEVMPPAPGIFCGGNVFFPGRSKAPRIPRRRCFRCGLLHSCCWSSHRRCSPPMRCEGRVLQGKGETGGNLKPPTWRGALGVTKKMYETLGKSWDFNYLSTITWLAPS